MRGFAGEAEVRFGGSGGLAQHGVTVTLVVVQRSGGKSAGPRLEPTMSYERVIFRLTGSAPDAEISYTGSVTTQARTSVMSRPAVSCSGSARLRAPS